MGADRTSQHPVINIKLVYKICFTMIHVTYTPKGRLVCLFCTAHIIQSLFKASDENLTDDNSSSKDDEH